MSIARTHTDQPIHDSKSSPTELLKQRQIEKVKLYTEHFQQQQARYLTFLEQLSEFQQSYYPNHPDLVNAFFEIEIYNLMANNETTKALFQLMEQLVRFKNKIPPNDSLLSANARAVLFSSIQLTMTISSSTNITNDMNSLSKAIQSAGEFLENPSDQDRYLHLVNAKRNMELTINRAASQAVLYQALGALTIMAGILITMFTAPLIPTIGGAIGFIIGVELIAMGGVAYGYGSHMKTKQAMITQEKIYDAHHSFTNLGANFHSLFHKKQKENVLLTASSQPEPVTDLHQTLMV